MSPTQRTGSFTAAAHLQPEAEIAQLKALFHRTVTHLQEATNDDRNYTFEVKITTFITVDPMQAKIGEYVHRDHFPFNWDTKDQTLEPQDAHAEKRVFRPRRLGYQRIE